MSDAGPISPIDVMEAHISEKLGELRRGGYFAEQGLLLAEEEFDRMARNNRADLIDMAARQERKEKVISAQQYWHILTGHALDPAYFGGQAE
jgi:hypothetical protein